MDISKIDKNFNLQTVDKPDVEWHELSEPEFSVHGIFYSEQHEKYLRMPQDLADQVNEGVCYLTRLTAGGRIRFITDSPYIALQAVMENVGISNHMPMVNQYGFSLYLNDKFYGILCASFLDVSHDKTKDIVYDRQLDLLNYGYKENEVFKVNLFTPCYGGIKKIYIGLKKGCKLLAHPTYKHAKPVLFYGSSITQGGCASRPGNDYVNMLSRKLDTEILNLGFSGSGRGESVIAEYVSNIDASVFVMDYDYNAKNPEHLRATHLPFYKTIRNKNPNTPIVMISRPNFGRISDDNERREIIRQTYEHAKTHGDHNVYFIDGETLFNGNDRDACTVDGVHPTDLGFYRMAKTLYPILDRLLNK